MLFDVCRLELYIGDKRDKNHLNKQTNKQKQKHTEWSRNLQHVYRTSPGETCLVLAVELLAMPSDRFGRMCSSYQPSRKFTISAILCLLPFRLKDARRAPSTTSSCHRFQSF